MNTIRNPIAVRARGTEILTADQIRNAAPSVFAEAAHESRSARYTYIPTSRILEGLIQSGFSPVYAAQSRTRIEGKAEFTRHLLKFRRVQDILAPAIIDGRKVGDEYPELSLINSHDGTSAYELSLGMFRLVCLNGLMVGTGFASEVKVHHRGNVVDNVIEGAFTVVQDFARVQDSAASMKAISLSPDEGRAFNRAALIARYGDEAARTDAETGRVTAIPLTTEQVSAPRRYADNGTDLWRTFNRAQENLVKGGVRAAVVTQSGRRQRTREVSGISQNVALNRALWTLAEEMKRLKG